VFWECIIKDRLTISKVEGQSVERIESPSWLGGYGLGWDFSLPASFSVFTTEKVVVNSAVVSGTLVWARDRARLKRVGEEGNIGKLMDAATLPNQAFAKYRNLDGAKVTKVGGPVVLNLYRNTPPTIVDLRELEDRLLDFPAGFGLLRGKIESNLEYERSEEISADSDEDEADGDSYLPLTWEEWRKISDLSPKDLAIKLHPSHEALIKRLYSKLPGVFAEAYLLGSLPSYSWASRTTGAVMDAVVRDLVQIELAKILLRRRRTTRADYFPMLIFLFGWADQQVRTLFGFEWRA
jgi:hypothetical protein